MSNLCGKHLQEQSNIKTVTARGDLMLAIVVKPVRPVKASVSVNDSIPSITPSESIVYVT